MVKRSIKMCVSIRLRLWPYYFSYFKRKVIATICFRDIVSKTTTLFWRKDTVEMLLLYRFVYAVRMYACRFSFHVYFPCLWASEGSTELWIGVPMVSLMATDCRLLFDSELRMEGQFSTEGMPELLGSFCSLVTTPLLGQSLRMLLMLLGCMCT